jgi:hypothetical protein
MVAPSRSRYEISPAHRREKRPSSVRRPRFPNSRSRRSTRGSPTASRRRSDSLIHGSLSRSTSCVFGSGPEDMTLFQVDPLRPRFLFCSRGVNPSFLIRENSERISPLECFGVGALFKISKHSFAGMRQVLQFADGVDTFIRNKCASVRQRAAIQQRKYGP